MHEYLIIIASAFERVVLARLFTVSAFSSPPSLVSVVGVRNKDQLQGKRKRSRLARWRSEMEELRSPWPLRTPGLIMHGDRFDS